MDLHQHAALSLPGAALAYLASGEALPAAAFMVGGVLIDLDHLVDYWRETGVNADWREFLGYFDARKPLHSFLPLHGWEWVLSFLALALSVGAPAWAWGLAGGVFCHLVLDHRYNRLHPWAYFFSFRWSVRFHPWSIYED